MDVGLEFGIPPFPHDKEAKTPVSPVSNFFAPIKMNLHMEENGGKKILLWSPGIPTFPSVFYFSTKFPARVLEQKAPN